MDRISNLPDEIICHIGSFLSAKEAAFASVLSKRWRNLFTIIPKLHFDGSVVSDGERFKDFVDGILDLPVSSRVRTFSLKCKDVAQFDEQINRCLCDVVKRGVMVLKLEIKVVEKGSYYSLPVEVFTCKTVAKMKLGSIDQKRNKSMEAGSGFAIDVLPADAFLPALETLFLDSVRFYDFSGRCAFETLLSASPVLEELVIDGIEWERWKWSCTVSSPTLRRLTIRRREWESYDESDEELVRLDCRGLFYDFDSVSLDIPGLTYLEYSDYVPKKYLIVNLNSLVEAKLDLCVDEDGYLWSQEDRYAVDFDPMNLINGIKNVEILRLNIYALDMFDVFSEAMPVFEKLSQISLSLSNFCWFPLPTLIKKSPNLKTLIIEDSLHCGRGEDGLVCQCMSQYSFLLACHVEILKINYYVGSIKELEQVKHFLGKLPSLELVKVHARVSSADKKLQVMADLLMLPRASTKCKIKVKFSAKRY